MTMATSFRQHRIRRAIVIRLPRQCVIYALLDPREPKHIRYVGHAFDTRRRLQQHIRSGALPASRSTRKGRWIAAILSDHVRPQLIVLESDVHPDRVLNREDHWIRRLLRTGHNLTNTQPQGSRPGSIVSCQSFHLERFERAQGQPTESSNTTSASPLPEKTGRM